jgi:hypothetical protein
MQTLSRLTGIVLGLTLLISVTAHGVNLVQNPGFETAGATITGAANWDGWDNGDGNLTRTNAVSHSGSYSFRHSTGSAWTHAIQSIAVSGLDNKGVVLTCYGYNPSADPLAGGKAGILKFEFYDGSATKLAEKDSWFINDASTQDTWIQGTVETIVPVGTVEIRVVLLGSSGSGSVYFDDINLEEAVVPQDTQIKNGGFEDGSGTDADDWGQSGGERSSDTAHSGSYSMKIKGFGGWENVLQPFVNTNIGGTPVIAKVYGLTPSGDKLTGGLGGLLKIQQSGTTAAYGEKWFMTGASPADTWVEGVVTANIPEGVSTFDYVLLIAGDSSGTVYFDDASVQIIPEPAAILGMLFMGGLLLRRKK